MKKTLIDCANVIFLVATYAACIALCGGGMGLAFGLFERLFHLLALGATGG